MQLFRLKCYTLATLLFITLLKNCKNNDFISNFSQNDYKMSFERTDVVRYNKDYVHYFQIRTFKYNRTCTAFNMTYKYKSNVDNLQLIIQAYKFASNEYRSFPIHFQVGLCSAFENDLAGLGNFTKCRNFNGCSTKKEQAYEICNFAPDETKFPPLIPSGRYMVEIQALHRSTEIWVFRSYAEVYRPFIGN